MVSERAARCTVCGHPKRPWWRHFWRAMWQPKGSLRYCTGVTATWCPVHGDCACPDDHDPTDAGYGIKDLDDPSCPLHSFKSNHADDEDRADA